LDLKSAGPAPGAPVAPTGAALSVSGDNLSDEEESIADDQELWVDQGWLVTDMQLQLMLGHVTKPAKAPLLRWVSNEMVNVDRIVVRCGTSSGSCARANQKSVSLPVADPLRILRFHVPADAAREQLYLYFDVYGVVGPPIARAFVLSSALLSKSEGAITCPLLGMAESKSHEVVGDLSFEYILITPFQHRYINRALGRTYSKSIRVIGHRGAGSDSSAQTGAFRRSHIAENTILSFVTASASGAQYVEFDVHLTRDEVPIVHHDFLFQVADESAAGRVGSSGVLFSAPVNQLTLADFMRLGGATRPRRGRSSSIGSFRELAHLRGDFQSVSLQELGFDASSSATTVPAGADAHARSTSYLRDHVTTLAETFVLVPDYTGFNIEIKYPCYEEAIEMDLHYIDRNRYVERILDTVFEYAGERAIIFSSFDPDVCRIVSMKQPR